MKFYVPITLICAGVSLLGGDGMVYAQQQETTIMLYPVFEEKNGIVEKINEETFMLTLKSFKDPENDTYSINDYYVARDAEITKNGEKVALKDIPAGTRVAIKYRTTREGVKEIVNIWMEEDV